MAIPLFIQSSATPGLELESRNPIRVYGGLSGNDLLLTLNTLMVIEGGSYIFELNEAGIKQGFKSTVETRDNEDGLEMYGVLKTHKLITLSGIARFFAEPKLSSIDVPDPVRNIMFVHQNLLTSVFDPALRTFQSPYGLRAEVQLVWRDYTSLDDHGDDNTSEKMIWVRPQSTPDIINSEYFGETFPFTLNLLAGDPRTYGNTLRSASWVSPYSPKIISSSGDYPTLFEEIRINMTGAGHASFLLTSTNPDYDNPQTFYSINLGGIGGGSHTVSLFPRDKNLVMDGFFRNDLFKSPPVWGLLPPSVGPNTTFTVSGTTNISSIVFYYRDAYSL